MIIYKYIDESCHLENDQIDVMTIGFVGVDLSQKEEYAKAIRSICLKHKVTTELKWNKLSNSKVAFYKDLIDFFFHANLTFRCVLVKNKQRLDHAQYNQGSYDNFYYKMVFELLKPYRSDATYRIFLDIKDTRGKEKLEKLQHYLTIHSSDKDRFKTFQHIQSHESIYIQLSDLFIGAVAFKARGLHLLENSSLAKKEIVSYLELKSGYDLDEGTEPSEHKFNIFDFQPKKPWKN